MTIKVAGDKSAQNATAIEEGLAAFTVPPPPPPPGDDSGSGSGDRKGPSRKQAQGQASSSQRKPKVVKITSATYDSGESKTTFTAVVLDSKCADTNKFIKDAGGLTKVRTLFDGATVDATADATIPCSEIDEVKVDCMGKWNPCNVSACTKTWHIIRSASPYAGEKCMLGSTELTEGYSTNCAFQVCHADAGFMISKLASPADAVDILVKPGQTTTDHTWSVTESAYSGNLDDVAIPVNVGRFDNALSCVSGYFGFDHGVVLSTGNIHKIANIPESGALANTDMTDATNANTRGFVGCEVYTDISYLKFKIKVSEDRSTRLRIQFVFASEELKKIIINLLYFL